jgi:hypothetical protein
MNRRGFAPILIILIVVVVIALGGLTLYYAAQRPSTPPPSQAVKPPEGPKACTQEAKQCPDGSYVSRTGPNCEFAACPQTTNSTAAGTLVGKVSIGPICPVERVGQPCPAPPEAYAARTFLVLSSPKKPVASFHADEQGNYRLSLPPGTYTVVSAKTGMGFMSKDLPRVVTIKAGQTTTLNISVDTGIR